MAAPQTTDKPRLRLPLATSLLSFVLGWGALKYVEKGIAQLPSSWTILIIGILLSCVLGLASYAVQWFLLDLKRDKIRFAKETGRTICHCTPSGEIMVRQEKYIDEISDYVDGLKCVHCGRWQVWKHSD